MFRRRWATAKAKYNNLPESILKYNKLQASSSVQPIPEPMLSLEILATIPSIPITDASPIALVLTCNREYYKKRLTANFMTWKILQASGFRVIFLFANPSITESSLSESEDGTCSLTVPIIESYDNLTTKMQLGFSFIVNKYPASIGILKIDDNTKIKVPSCLQELNSLISKNIEYIGVNVNIIKRNTNISTSGNERYSIFKDFSFKSTHNFIYYGGPLYWVSMRIIKIISNISDFLLPWEDMNIGYAISLLPSKPLMFLAPWKDQRKIIWEDDYEQIQKCTIELLGQLGNHMFQLAAILRHCKVNNMMPQLVLAHPKQISYYTTMLPRCKEFIVPRNRFVNRKTPFKYIPIAPTATELYGYLQSSKYFSDEKEYIKEMFTPEPSVQGICDLKYASLLALKDDTTVNVVVIHVRRGDYLNHPTTHGILTPKYFNNAIAEMSSRLENPQFLMFSDDTPYCRTTFTNTNLQVIDEPDPNLTFCLMKQFSNFILSNSTFSWWACYLSQKPGVVIVPDKWFGLKGPQDFEDIYEPEWIRIKAE